MNDHHKGNAEDIIQVAYELGLRMRNDPRINRGSTTDAISVGVCLLSALMAADIITSIGPDYKDRYIDLTLKVLKEHIELDLKRLRENVL